MMTNIILRYILQVHDVIKKCGTVILATIQSLAAVGVIVRPPKEHDISIRLLRGIGLARV